MKMIGNIRRMKTELIEGVVNYHLPLYHVTEPRHLLSLNELVGKDIRIRFDGNIHCVDTGKKIKKTFGEGFCYQSFMDSPMASPSIIRPELSRIHEGIALRDFEWENKYHNRPHIVYLALTAGIKVGVTSEANVPYRWMDQGAVQAIIFAEVPYRQLAGVIEVELKGKISDVTNWRKMLTNTIDEDIDLMQYKEVLSEEMSDEYYDFVSENDEVWDIEYPVLSYPEKVKSIKLDKVPFFEKRLIGIKGQYLLFDDQTVINMRSHSGYEIELEV